MNRLKTLYFNDVLQIPDEVFEYLGCTTSFYFEKQFLEAFAKANPSIENKYLVIYKGEDAQALISIQQLKIALDNTPEELSLHSKVAQILHAYLNSKQVNSTVCGNIFLSGNFGIFIKENVNQKVLYERIAQEMKSLKVQDKSSVLFLKDFATAHITDVSRVKKHQFQTLAVSPNMRLKLSWPDFKTYKSALRSKYRIKINKADSQSSKLRV